MSFSNPQEFGNPITIFDEGISVTNNVGSLDFVGSGVVATAIGRAATITIAGGGAVTPSNFLLMTGDDFLLMTGDNFQLMN